MQILKTASFILNVDHKATLAPNRKPTFKVLVPVAICALFFAALWLRFHPVFATIDDARLLYIYAGYASGTPTGTYLFSNAVWGNLLADLYSAIPNFNWYAAYHFTEILISACIVSVAIYKNFMNEHHGVVAAFGIQLLTLACVYLNAALIMHFEVTACLIGIAGIAIIYLVDIRNDSILKAIVLFLISSVFIILCFLQEKNTFYSIMVFFAIACIYQLLKHAFGNMASEKARKKFSGNSVSLSFFFICTIVVCVALGSYNSTALEEDWNSYLSYNKYRVSYYDYDHPTYEEDTESYESAGWSEAFYDAAESTFFMDERFNEEALSRIVKPFSRTEVLSEGSSIGSIFTTLSKVIRSTGSEGVAKYQVLFSLGLFTYAIWCLRRNGIFKARKLEFLMFLAATLAGIALLLYLAWRGRLPLRAWEVVMFPMLLTQIILLARIASFKPDENSIPDKQLILRIVLACSLVTCLSFSFYSAYQTPKTIKGLKTEYIYRHKENTTMNRITDFAINHPENMYVYSSGIQNYNPDSFFEEDAIPTNLIPTGTSYVWTPVWKDQIRTNGFEEFLPDVFEKGNVYFIDDLKKPEIFNAISNLLLQDYGMNAYEVVDHIDSKTRVIKFLRRNESDIGDNTSNVIEIQPKQGIDEPIESVDGNKEDDVFLDEDERSYTLDGAL